MRKRGESGFALLLVFLMAAVIAITLYMQIPRVAFQAQRQKEQLLIERGGQYKRAIQLFFRVNHRYPGEIKDLENFNNRRFLRHKFIDPITGKDDWRLVHINNGVLTDSVVNKNKPGDAKQPAASTAGTYVGEQAGLGSSPAQAQQNQNLALTRRRASEGGAAQPVIGPDGQPVVSGQPITGFAPVPGQPLPGQPIPGQPFPARTQTQPGGQPFPDQNAGQTFPGQIGGQPFPGTPPLPGQVPGQPYPGTIPGQPAPGTPVIPGQVQAQPFRGDEPIPGQPSAFPGGRVIPGQVPGQPQPFPGGQAAPGQVPGQPIPGRLPGFAPPGAQPNPGQSQTSTPYVGGNQPYVGGAQPYVGGGAYVGSSASPAPGIPTPTQPSFNPNQVNPTTNPGNPQPFSPQQPFSQQPFSQQPVSAAAPGTPLSSGLPGSPSSSAATGLINGILQNPRPAPQPNSQPAGQQIGGGIAGVASKSEDAAIMVYNERTNYNEWEFVYDYTKERQMQNPNAGGIGTPAANLGSVPGTTNPGVGAARIGGFGAIPGASLGTTPGAGLGTTPGASPGGANPAGRGGAAGNTQQLPPELRPGRP